MTKDQRLQRVGKAPEPPETEHCTKKRPVCLFSICAIDRVFSRTEASTAPSGEPPGCGASENHGRPPKEIRHQGLQCIRMDTGLVCQFTGTVVIFQWLFEVLQPKLHLYIFFLKTTMEKERLLKKKRTHWNRENLGTHVNRYRSSH